MQDDDLLDDLLSWQDTSSRKSGLSSSDASINVRAGQPPQKPSPLCPAHPPSLAETAMTAQTNTQAEDQHLSLHLPDAVREKLFDYQLEGIQWLHKKHRTGRACLLADEMGLGKTVQVCTFLGALFKQKEVKTAIIVVPPTLVPMWSEALENWADLKPPVVEVLHNDTKTKRQARWRRLSHGIPTIFLTTYGVLRQDVRQMSAQIVDYVILDEAHLIKDASTQASKSAMELSARHKVALTGTPLMNSFEDMWSLFCFLDGGIIGQSRADFRAISHVLLRGNERDASSSQRGEAEAELSKLQTAILPYMLRREKRDLQVVRSQKQDTVVWVRLTETQRSQYSAFLETKEVEASRGSEDGTNPLMLLTMLGQICNHPWLNLTDEALRDAVQRPFVAPCDAVGDITSGAKLCVALSLITRSINQGRKVLVFSRSKVQLTLLSARLAAWLVPHTRIDGDCNSEDRFARVNDFNKDAVMWVCLLTTQVGGVGLTFDAASCVILMDPSWNPSADAQAVDRIHRIGQTRDVLVYRLITSGTVEEKIYRNQVFKTMAAKQSMRASEENADMFRYFTRIQLRSMFELGTLDRSETAEQLAQLHPGKVCAEMLQLPEQIPLVCAVSDNGSVLSDDVVLDEEQLELDEALQWSQGSGSGVGVPAKRTHSRSSTPPPLASTDKIKCRRVEASQTVATQEEVETMVGELEKATAALGGGVEIVVVPASPADTPATTPPSCEAVEEEPCLANACVPEDPLVMYHTATPVVEHHVEPTFASRTLPIADMHTEAGVPKRMDALPVAPALSVVSSPFPPPPTVCVTASDVVVCEPALSEVSDELEDPSRPQQSAGSSPHKHISGVFSAFRQLWS